MKYEISTIAKITVEVKNKKELKKYKEDFQDTPIGMLISPKDIKIKLKS